jgi:ABC-type antimicrobial peptide transport system permease subunit
VAQRTKEIGIRRALGAQNGDILSLVVGQGLRMALAGTLLGLVAAWMAMRLLRAELFQVSASDPVTYGCVAGLFVLAALLASYLPARRAAGIDPQETLRVS